MPIIFKAYLLATLYFIFLHILFSSYWSNPANNRNNVNNFKNLINYWSISVSTLFFLTQYGTISSIYYFHYVKSSQQENFRLSYYFDPIFFYWEKYYICLLLCQYYVVGAWRAHVSLKSYVQNWKINVETWI